MALGARLLAEAQGAVRHQDVTGARHFMAEARDAGVDAASLANLESDLRAVQAPPSPPPAAVKPPVPPAPLQPIIHADPVYPPSALSRGTKGMVELQYIVRQDGTTDDIVILGASPPGVFDRAAIEAVRHWRYRPPVLRDGTPTQIQTTVIVRFTP
jgi:protein TonB